MRGQIYFNEAISNYRISALRNSLREVNGIIITNMSNIRYLTGFSGSSALLLVTKKHCIFVTDFRYKEMAERGLSACEMVIEKNRMKTIRMLLARLGLNVIGFERTASYEFFERLSSIGVRLKPMKAVVEKLRAIKDSSELSSIKEAIRRAEKSFLEVMPYIKKGLAERAIARRLEEELKKNGCNQIPFDIIVASGKNSAMPHAKVTDKKLVSGDLVIIDWGGEAQGYFSDMTRTLLIKGGNISKKIEIYNITLEAGKKGISSIRDGMSSRVIDNTVRDVIKKAGYGRFFGHGSGHGVGLEVHERPYIKAWSYERLTKGMVFTIEPGIYMPHIGGVRIEDMILMGERRAEVLTSLPKELKIIG